MKPLHITVLQLDLAWEDAIANRSKIEQQLESVAATDLIVLPEMFTTGFSMNAAPLAEPMGGDTHTWMQELAEKYDALIMGSIIIEEEKKYYNRMLCVAPEGLLAQYDKRHLFRIGGEHEPYIAGQEKVIFSYKGWRICPQICYDLRFPVFCRNVHTKGIPEYDLLVFVANWPDRRSSHWRTLLAARAIDNQAFVVGVNRVGVDEVDLSYDGCSSITDFMGKNLAFNEGDETILSATIDPEGMNQWRKSFPMWMDADVFEIKMEERALV